MKRLVLLSMVVMFAAASFGRSRVSSNATVVSDTIFYAKDMRCATCKGEASYYRILMKDGKGVSKKDVFRDFYLDGTLKAEGGYSFIDLGNDANTVLNGDVTTYYANGKEKWHGKYVNGKRNGYFTMQMRDGSVAVAEFVNGKSKHNYFMVTLADGTMQKRPIADLKSLL